MLGHIAISDINEALPRALPMLLRHGVPVTAASVANARPTIEWPGLFVTEYWNPVRNVSFDPIRDANPYFHYFEALWIIAGRDDVRTLAHILPRMADYSDDGSIFHGAYGYRLRNWHTGDGGCIDQIEQAINILRGSPTSRQVVLSIWNPAKDLGTKTKDMPCNDMIMLKVRDGHLNITVSNRSNDAVLGCYGANAVQFSMLQMYMAARLGLGVGTYCQVSDSFHVYEDNPYWQWFKAEYERNPDRWALRLHDSRTKYAELGCGNLFVDNTEAVDAEIAIFFMEVGDAITAGNGRPRYVGLNNAKTTAVKNAVYLYNSLMSYRMGDYSAAMDYVWAVQSPDWQYAARQWLERRFIKQGVKP
jgi:hypothetical protein